MFTVSWPLAAFYLLPSAPISQLASTAPIWDLEIKVPIQGALKQITCLAANRLAGSCVSQTSQGDGNPNDAVTTFREGWAPSSLQ